MDKIKKLETKSEIINSMNIKENINDLDSIDDFISIYPEKIILIDKNGKEFKTKLVKSIKENAFYKKSSGEYYRFKVKEKKLINQEVIEWANKLKNYIDSNDRNLLTQINNLTEENKAINRELINLKLKIKELDKSFKDGLEQTNELTDLKIKNINNEEEFTEEFY